MNNKNAIIFVALFLIFSSSGQALTQESDPIENKDPIVSSAQTDVSVSNTDTTPAQTVPVVPEKPASEKMLLLDSGNVTINFKGADIKTVLAYISEVSGVDIVPAPDVKGVIDLKLTNKPWKVALDIILRNYGFAYEREGDIIRVVTVSQLKQEELASQAFSLNYSKCKDVVDSIKNIVSEKGKVTFDERTNTVIVTDIPTNLYKISQIISRLDKKTQQVLIDARVIETVLGDDEKMGINWGVKVSASGAKRPITFPFSQFALASKWLPQVQVTSPTMSTSITGSSVTETTDFPHDATGVSAFPYATTDDYTFGTLDFTGLTAVLEMLKERTNTDVVSNPRIATLNNHEALINVGQTLNMPTYERNSSTGKMEITGYTAKDLGIILKVTPHINDVGEIVVDLEPQITDLLRYDTLDATSGVVAPVFSTRIAKTQVMIKNGQTIFIGGLIKENDVNMKHKLPIIGDLCENVPILGFMTSKKEITKQKTELIFFITVNLMEPGQGIKDIPIPSNVYTPAYTMIRPPDSGDTKKGKKK